jgi:hypothetical protein
VDSEARDAEQTIDRTLAFAEWLGQSVTLATVVDRQRYQQELWPPWPSVAFAPRAVSVDRVVLGGEPAAALSNYADRIRATAILVPAESGRRRWFRRIPLAQELAGLTSRAVWILPAEPKPSRERELRVACMVRGDGTDYYACTTAAQLAERWNATLLLIALEPENAKWTNAVEHTLAESANVLSTPFAAHSARGGTQVMETLRTHGAGVLVSARHTFVSGDADRARLLSMSPQLPCPLLSIPVHSTASAPSTGNRSARLTLVR